MSKLMFALRGVVSAEVLLAPDVVAALAAVGVTRWQVNVDDAAVADALRLSTGEPPIGAVLSTWGGDPEAVLAVVVGVGVACGVPVDGWSVEERRPIDPDGDDALDGARQDTLANIAFLRRPDELSAEEWQHRWLVDHTPIAMATQGTFGYLQNVVTGVLVESGHPSPPVAALVEELFPTAAIGDVHAFYGSGGDDAELSSRIERLMVSVARIGADRDLDLVPTSRHLLAVAPSGSIG